MREREERVPDVSLVLVREGERRARVRTSQDHDLSLSRGLSCRSSGASEPACDAGESERASEEERERKNQPPWVGERKRASVHGRGTWR